MNKRKTKLFLTITSVVIFLSIFILGFTTWMVKNFGDVSFEQYYFGIMAPTAGTPMSFYVKIGLSILVVIIITVVIAFIFKLILKSEKGKLGFKKVILGLISACLLLFSIYNMDSRLKISKHLLSGNTSFFEENYVRPTTELIEFPEKKKNIIFIYLESFENTYFSKELGGDVEYNLMPNITNLLNEEGSINFSHQNEYGGPRQAPETGYSIAGMFATQSGLPFKVPINGHEYAENNRFAPGSITLGDILKKEGYNMEFLVGANGLFAGVTNFYETHGDWNVLDYVRAQEQGLIPSDYKEWWGFEDRKLFEFSKQKLDIISQEDKPFAMVIEADDSHFPDGYTDASCSTNYEEPYENSISCVDSMVNEFIDYLKQQDYYKDTIIVLHGDHLSMEKDYFDHKIDPEYQRTTFNAYLNVDPNMIEEANNKNRTMATMDVFPTTLAAMGVKVKGERLGIGTNLFSDVPTIYEYYGVPFVDAELSMRSEYFYEKFLWGKDTYE